MKKVKKLLAMLLALVMTVSVFSVTAAEALATDTIDLEVYYGFGKAPGTINKLTGVFTDTNGLVDQNNGYSIKGSLSSAYTNGPASGTNENRYDHPKQGEISSVDVYYGGSFTPLSIATQVSNSTDCIKGTMYVTSGGVLTTSSSGNTKVVTFAAAAKGNNNAMASRWFNIKDDIDLVIHYKDGHFISFNTGQENAVFSSADIPDYFFTKTNNTASIEIGAASYSNATGISATVTPTAPPTGIAFTIGGNSAVLNDCAAVKYLTGSYTWSDSHESSDILKYDNGTYTFYKVTDDISINYAYTLENVTATFMADGDVFDTQEILSGTTLSEPDPAPAKPGYALEGWYTDPQLTDRFDFSTPVTANITLYAKFAEDHTVSFRGAGTFISAGVNVTSSTWSSITGGTVDQSGTLVTHGDFSDNASATSSGVQIRVNSDIGTLDTLTFAFGGYTVPIAKTDLVNNAIYLSNTGTLSSSFNSNTMLKYAISNGVVFLRLYQIKQDIEVTVGYEGGTETVGAQVTGQAALLTDFEVTQATAGTSVSLDGFTVPYYELKGTNGNTVQATLTVREPETYGIRLQKKDGTEIFTYKKGSGNTSKQIDNIGWIELSYDSASSTYTFLFKYLIQSIDIALLSTTYSEDTLFMSAEVVDTVTAKFSAIIAPQTAALYDSIVMRAALGSDEPVLLEGRSEDGETVFEFEEIPAYRLNEKLTCEIYGEKDGVLTDLGIGLINGISIAEYCDIVADNHSGDLDLLRFMANLLNFASEFQKYVDPDAAAEALPITGREWAEGRILDETPVSPNGMGDVRTDTDGFNASLGYIRSAGLNISDRAAVFFLISAPKGLDGIALTVNGEAFDNSGLTHISGSNYRLTLTRIAPTGYDSIITVTLTNSSGSQTVKYSVDTYCERMNGETGMGALTSAIYNLGYASRTTAVIPRIAFVGDSITFGYVPGYNDSEVPEWSYPSRLQEMMGGNAVIGNFGRSGSFVTPLDASYNYWAGTDKADRYYPITTQYTDSIAFEPDIVVIMLGINDNRNIRSAAEANSFKNNLKNLADTYAALPSVDKVYIATSTYAISSNTVGIVEMSSGELQRLQKEAAAAGGYDVIDIYGMVGDYLSEGMHYSADRLHPDATSLNEIAKAFYAFFKNREYVPGNRGTSSTGVVYVKTGGTGDGSTPAKAMASLPKAVGLIRETGGTIVLCDDYTTEYSYDIAMPVNRGRIKITSSYGGTDFGGKLILTQNLYLHGDYTFENLTMVADRTTAAPLFVCRYNNVTFGEGITVQEGSAAKGYPGILAGYYNVSGGASSESASFSGTCTINVQSGTWGFFRGGNVRSQAVSAMGSVKSGATVTVNISGGTFMNASGNNLCAATGMNSLAGTTNLNISGGTFSGPVCVICRPGTNTSGQTYSMAGTVNVNITGGTFNDVVRAMQEPVSYSAALNVNIDDLMENKPALEGFDDRVPEDVFLSGSFTDSHGTTLPYRYYLPEGYDKTASKTYPVFFYFHGNGSRGTDNKKQIDVGTHKIVANVLNYEEDAIIVAAQCPASPYEWVDHTCYPGHANYDPESTPVSTYLEAALQLYNSFITNEKVDTERIYIAGASNGAGACWNVIAKSPKTVAAAVILAGTGQTGGAENIAEYYLNTPIWTFHGDADATLSVEGTRGIVNAVLDLGGTMMTYTEMPGYGHNIWTAAANTSGLIDWMFAQRRTDSVGIFRLNGEEALTHADLVSMR